MKCDDCGKCCQFILVSTEVLTDDHKRWLELHKGIHVIGWDTLKIDIPCSALKDNRCTIYEDRPKICRWYDCDSYENKKFKHLLDGK